MAMERAEAELRGEAERRERLFAVLRAHEKAEQLTDRRIERIVEVALKRLGSVTVVMENLWNPHNVSAVVRSAEGFGLDAVHVVEQPNKYQPKKSVVKGADRWVRIERHQGLARCLGDLVADGYEVVAADLGRGTVPLHEVPVDRPVAIVLGSELDGLSKRAKGMVDTRFEIPMPGFTVSFNVSVSAAIALYDLTTRRREHLGQGGDLPFEALERRAVAWLEKSAQRRRGNQG